jgi:hypothetical protein
MATEVASECGDRIFDLAGVAHPDHAQLRTDGRYGLDCGKLTNSGGHVGISQHRDPCQGRCGLFGSSSHLAAIAYSNTVKPVALLKTSCAMCRRRPPGLALLGMAARPSCSAAMITRRMRRRQGCTSSTRKGPAVTVRNCRGNTSHGRRLPVTPHHLLAFP